jgi:hypothetical protein
MPSTFSEHPESLGPVDVSRRIGRIFCNHRIELGNDPLDRLARTIMLELADRVNLAGFERFKITIRRNTWEGWESVVDRDGRGRRGLGVKERLEHRGIVGAQRWPGGADGYYGGHESQAAWVISF